MNKKICFLVLFLIIVIGVIIGIFILTKNESTNLITDKDDTTFIKDYEFLYDKAIDYIVEQSKLESRDKDKEDYQVFTDYEGFGIEEKDNKKIAYMWILEESYYVEDNELQSGEGSSMAYKFTFKNNEVIDYQVPEDGIYYASSIKDMFPDNIEDEVISFGMDDTKLKEQVKEHYSYLDSIDKTNDYFTGTVVEGGDIMEKVTNINVSINDKKYNATIENNETAQNLISRLPQEFNMKELNENEKYVYMDYSLPTNSINPKHIESGDIMLYGNDCLVIFYKSFDTNYSYTRIGHIDNLPDLGNGSIIIRMDI